MSVTGTHIWPALTETKDLKKLNFEAKNSFNLKLFLASAIFFFLHCRTSARHGRSTTGISM